MNKSEAKLRDYQLQQNGLCTTDIISLELHPNWKCVNARYVIFMIVLNLENVYNLIKI